MIATLIAYAAALGLAAAIPGPGVAALVGQSMGSGLKAALFLLAGIALGDVVYLTVAIAGLAAIAQTFAGVFLIVKVLGGVYLLYLAFKLWQSTTGATKVEASKGQTNLGSFLTGFSVTMGNPKTIVFYLALLPTVLDLNQVGPGQWAMLVAVTIGVLIVTLAPYAALAARARGMMTKPGALSRLNRFASGIIGATGVLILGQAITTVARRS
ncbi:LysE family translocator [Falsirhodobacter deserti]|uniref:LysE family translocator n=1 Tax=Falsirhodobacter deserti TaxID=1365611 RepID=UPI001F4E184B|nr:LysE family translocator [Falsirhodobacter deserti]